MQRAYCLAPNMNSQTTFNIETTSNDTTSVFLCPGEIPRIRSVTIILVQRVTRATGEWHRQTGLALREHLPLPAPLSLEPIPSSSVRREKMGLDPCRARGVTGHGFGLLNLVG